MRPEIIDTRGWADDDQKIKTGHINTVGALDKLFRNRYWTRKEFRNWCEKIFGVDEMATHRWCRKWGVVWDEKGELAFVTLRRVYEDDPLVKMVRQSHRKALPTQKGAPPPAPEPSGGLQSEVARQIALLDEIARTAPRIADRNSAIREKSLLLGLHREDVQDKLARETSSTETDVERCRRIGLKFREALGLPTDDLPAEFKKIIEETKDVDEGKNQGVRQELLSKTPGKGGSLPKGVSSEEKGGTETEQRKAPEGDSRGTGEKGQTAQCTLEA